MLEIHDLLMDAVPYNEIEHHAPYIFKIEKEGQSLIYFGSRHCFDAEDKQNIDIENLRNEFLAHLNTKKIAIIENKISSPLSNTKENIEKYGEMGLVRSLAHESNIPYICPEPTFEDKIAHLEKFFSKRDILYSKFGVGMSMFHHQNRERDWQSFVMSLLERFRKLDNRKDEDISIEKCTQIHEELFHIVFDPQDEEHWKKLDNPTLYYGITNEISRKEDEIREISIVKSIIDKRID